MQYLMGMAPEVPTYFYSYSDLNPYTPENEGFLTWLVTMAGEQNPPLVHSLSYGDVEADVFNSTNGAAPYAARVDLEFAKLSARGMPCVASGDDGSTASSRATTPCRAASTPRPVAASAVRDDGGCAS